MLLSNWQRDGGVGGTLAEECAIADGYVNAKEVAASIIQAGLSALQPSSFCGRQIEYDGQRLVVAGRSYDLDQFDRVIVLAVGKASPQIVHFLEGLLGERLSGGISVVREADAEASTNRITTLVSDHPLPSERSVYAAGRLLQAASSCTERDIVMAVITGGSSALACLPGFGVSLASKRQLHKDLLASGARIQDVNSVRKHLSAIKGGRLALAGSSATWINLTVSDVVDDQLDCITDLTVTDGSTKSDAIRVLETYGLAQSLPSDIKRALKAAPETNPLLSDIDIHTTILASGLTAATAMRHAAETMGFKAIMMGARVEGEARSVGSLLGSLATESGLTGSPFPRHSVLIGAGGEATVALPDVSTHGGPNQEVALAFANSLRHDVDVAGMFIDSDGLDGPTEFAGGLVDNQTGEKLANAGVDAAQALIEHRATTALSAVGDVVRLGSTGTNVSDLFTIVIA